MNKCYCVSYCQGTYIDDKGVEQTYDPDCDYIYASSDEEAVKEAFRMAKCGIDYADIGHQPLEVLSVCEFDEELGDDVRTVWI